MLTVVVPVYNEDEVLNEFYERLRPVLDSLDMKSELLIIMLFLGGIQLLALGLIGEYLGRMFDETKNRPPYLVNKYEKPG